MNFQPLFWAGLAVGALVTLLVVTVSAVLAPVCAG